MTATRTSSMPRPLALAAVADDPTPDRVPGRRRGAGHRERSGTAHGGAEYPHAWQILQPSRVTARTPPQRGHRTECVVMAPSSPPLPDCYPRSSMSRAGS
ncbi:hypothetical protein GCM10010446_55400 [Streptomyces enissocaesilis]|uniref:Uncharacterized protein n=1 Tax=Streptomyces enissocaesilis TaxID=332589 RepID=A0ABP6K5T5_9ACTN